MDPSYLSYLRGYDSHVPAKQSRPWLWAVDIDGVSYGVPCTTHDSGSGFIGYLRCGTVPKAGLNLRYMAPIPMSALKPLSYSTHELRAELLYYEMNRNYIESEARLLRELSVSGRMDQMFYQHSCNFRMLEKIYSKWTPGRDAGHFLYPKEDELDMPISKNGNPYYTKEQYHRAVYESSALDYAKSQGYELIQEKNWYRLKEHDSMVFTPNGSWFWNSRGLRGGALEFMMYYEGKTVTEAVLTLANDPEYTRGLPPEQAYVLQRAPAVSQDLARQRAVFSLPREAKYYTNLYQYLCERRGLEQTVVREMIRQGRLYQSEIRLQNGRTVYNACFVYRDAQDKPVGAYQRGTMDREGQKPYKRDVPGSDKSWGWLLRAPEARAVEVRVFEAAIDAASDASFRAMENPVKWRFEPIDRLSLEGLFIKPLQNYLQAHPDVLRVTFMLDADEPGRRAGVEFAQQLRDSGFEGTIDILRPPLGKDWNDTLLETRAMEAEAMEAVSDEPMPEPDDEMEL